MESPAKSFQSNDADINDEPQDIKRNHWRKVKVLNILKRICINEQLITKTNDAVVRNQYNPQNISESNATNLIRKRNVNEDFSYYHSMFINHKSRTLDYGNCQKISIAKYDKWEIMMKYLLLVKSGKSTKPLREVNNIFKPTNKQRVITVTNKKIILKNILYYTNKNDGILLYNHEIKINPNSDRLLLVYYRKIHNIDDNAQLENYTGNTRKDNEQNNDYKYNNFHNQKSANYLTKIFRKYSNPQVEDDAWNYYKALSNIKQNYLECDNYAKQIEKIKKTMNSLKQRTGSHNDHIQETKNRTYEHFYAQHITISKCFETDRTNCSIYHTQLEIGDSENGSTIIIGENKETKHSKTTHKSRPAHKKSIKLETVPEFPEIQILTKTNDSIVNVCDQSNAIHDTKTEKGKTRKHKRFYQILKNKTTNFFSRQLPPKTQSDDRINKAGFKTKSLLCFNF